MRNTLLFFALLLSGIFFSCQSGNQENEEDEGTVTEEVVVDEFVFEAEKNGIKVSSLTDSPEFPDAVLTLKNDPAADSKEGITHFSFGVENYELAVQTTDAGGKCCANSAKGQHIHLIVNNEPYTAHYEAEIDREMAPGNYAVLAFLSRSYHESIKNGTAYKLFNMTVGDAEPQEADLKAEHLFYSRPKGTYAPDDCSKLMLDFYLVNTDLSEDGNKVRATINGVEFMLPKWCPYVMEGLPRGENTIKLELIDKDGNLVPGPFNSVERTVTLQPDEEGA